MVYSIDEEVPEYWNFIIDGFVKSVEHYEQYNKMPEVYNLQFDVKRGLLDIQYSGGDKITDALAFMSRRLSESVCFECGSPSQRVFAGKPLCGECD